MNIPQDPKEIKIVKEDKWLEPFADQIKNRLHWADDHLNYLKDNFGGISKFADAYKYYGFNYDKKKKGWWYREWAPNAFKLTLIGDFNDWDPQANVMSKDEFGVWTCFLDDETYSDKLSNFSLVKVRVESDLGVHDRIPAYIQRVVQDPNDHSFCGQIVFPSTYKWENASFKRDKKQAPLIYECHIGMASEESKVGSFEEFRKDILPRIVKLGYNTIQMMAVQEHPYYGSFGYHVSNFFAVSSRFGTPDELRKLIDEAHANGVSVVMDVVHSHSVKNFAEGLHQFDGNNDCYFINGPQGWHPDWDSRLFDYGNIEVERFLLSNLKFWLSEFKFDGFRFDGVTSMLYHHHGNTSFDAYSKYFGEGVDNSAVLYLQMANKLVHSLNTSVISIAEDMSGYPGACRKIEDGGLGFDYRLAMGIPDYWIKLLKHKSDDQWQMGDIWWELTNRRMNEKTVAYSESHDQALVGDKTLAFWLMDKAMYTDMSVFSQSMVVDRGISLHKLIRFITITLGGEAYLNFMGNEFGHPEWIDFPREGNNWSYQYARRQWSLPDTEHLKYKYLQNFDQAMIKFVGGNKVLNDSKVYKLMEDEANKVLIFEKNSYVFVFNFNPVESLKDYHFYVRKSGKYKVVFSSDDEDFGGFERVDKNYIYSSFKENDVNKLSLFLPNRSALVLIKQ